MESSDGNDRAFAGDRTRDGVQAGRFAIARATRDAIDFATRSYEGRSTAELREDFVPRVRELAQRTSDALSQLLAAMHDVPDATPLTRAADLAFVGRWELTAKLRELDTVDDEEDAWVVVAYGASIRRRICRIGSAIDGLLAAAVGDESDLVAHDRDELQRSVAVRQRYMELRSAIRGTVADARLDDERRLRLVAVNLAKLVGARIYEDLRMSDRIAFRELQRRILACLRSVRGGGAVEHEEERLLADVLAFGELLTRVNDRAELRQHDLERIRRVQESIDAQRSTLDAVREELAVMRGRDEELDELLASATSEHDPAIRSCLERNRIALGGAASNPVNDVDDTVELLLGSN